MKKLTIKPMELLLLDCEHQGPGQGPWFCHCSSWSSQMAFSLCWWMDKWKACIFQDVTLIFENWELKKEIKMVLYFCHLHNYNFDIMIKQCMVTFAICCTMTFIISLSNAMFLHPESYKCFILSDDWLNIPPNPAE